MARLYGPGPGDPPALVSTHDLSGLPTNDVEDRPIGELFGALSEERSGLIRYLDVSVPTASKHVLVPIGHVRISRDTPPRVRLRAAAFEDLVSIPDYEPDRTTVDGPYQARVLEVHGRLFYGSRYYAHPAFDHPHLHAGAAEILGPDEVSDGASALRPLSELPRYRVARAQYDIRGHALVDAHGERTGEVSDLLVEVSAKKARYAVVQLAGPERSAPAREAAIPVGYLEVDEEHDRVTTPALTREDVRLLPPYEPPLDRAQENRIHATVDSRLSGARLYERPDFRSNAQPPATPAGP